MAGSYSRRPLQGPLSGFHWRAAPFQDLRMEINVRRKFRTDGGLVTTDRKPSLEEPCRLQSVVLAIQHTFEARDGRTTCPVSPTLVEIHSGNPQRTTHDT